MKRSLMMALRSHLRRSGLTQAELARRLRVSVPTIKRWLRGQGMDLEALERVLPFAGVTLAELAAEAEGQVERAFSYTLEQEEFLSRTPKALAVFDHLLFGVTPAWIAKRAGLSATSLAQALRGLERVGLVERLQGERVRLKVSGAPQWRPGGALSRAYGQAARGSFLAQAAREGSSSQGAGDATRFVVYRLLPEDLRQAQARADELHAFLSQAERRARATPDRARLHGCLTAVAPFDWAVLERGE